MNDLENAKKDSWKLVVWVFGSFIFIALFAIWIDSLICKDNAWDRWRCEKKEEIRN